MVVIVISGMPGCGSSTTARLLAKKLGLKHFSVGDYNKSHVKNKESETSKAIEMWKKDSKFLKKFHNDSDEMARKIARKGDVVIDAKLGIKLIDGLYDFSVWLKADKEVRAARYSERDKKSISDSKKSLLRKEKLERDNFKKIYGFDYFLQEGEADLIVDTADKTPNEIVKIIINEVRARGLME